MADIEDFTTGETLILLGIQGPAEFHRDVAPQLEIVEIIPKPLGRPALHYSRESVERYFGRPFTPKEIATMQGRVEIRRKAARTSAEKARKQARTRIDPSTGKPWVRLGAIPKPILRALANQWRPL